MEGHKGLGIVCPKTAVHRGCINLCSVTGKEQSVLINSSSTRSNIALRRELITERTSLAPSGWQGDNLNVFYFAIYFVVNLYVINNTDFSIVLIEVFIFVSISTKPRNQIEF